MDPSVDDRIDQKPLGRLVRVEVRRLPMKEIIVVPVELDINGPSRPAPSQSLRVARLKPAELVERFSGTMGIVTPKKHFIWELALVPIPRPLIFGAV